MDYNPWQVNTIQEFSYYKCPECTFEIQEEQFFQAHAVENHPLSYVFFGKNNEEEEFNDPIKVEDFTSDGMVIRIEKLPIKKEILFENEFEATQSTENFEAKVSLNDEFRFESETSAELWKNDDSSNQVENH